MGNPLTDSRANELLTADSGEISTLASTFQRVSSQARAAAAGLRGAQHDATWTGQAATAFRGQVGKLPGQLDKVQQSYGEVATALDSYGSQLGPIQSQFRSLASQLSQAQWSLSNAQSQLSTARSNLSAATSAPHAKPTSPDVVNAHSAVSSASSSVGNLQSEVSGLQSRGYQLLDEFSTIRGHAQSRVSSAKGIAPSQSWLSSALSSIGGFFEGVGKGIIHDIADLPHAIANVWDHPGDLAAWGELVKDVAVTASIVAMAAAPFAAPELLEADAAAEGAGEAAAGAAGEAGAAEGGDAAASTASKLVSGFRTGARYTSDWGGHVAQGAGGADAGIEAGQGNYKAALIDAAFVAAPNLIGGIPKSVGQMRGPGDVVVNMLGFGDRQASAAADAAKAWNGTEDQIMNYQLLRRLGSNDAGAKQIVFGGQVPDVLKDLNLSDSRSLAAARQASITADNVAATRALRYGRPAAGLIDKFGFEPGQDAIKHKLAPQPAGA